MKLLEQSAGDVRVNVKVWEGGGGNDSGVVWENMWHLAGWLGQNTQTCGELAAACSSAVWPLNCSPGSFVNFTCNTLLVSANMYGHNQHTPTEKSYWMANCFDCKLRSSSARITRIWTHRNKMPNLDISHFYSNSISEKYVKCRKVKPI